jgi:hypothetical protein
LPDGIFSGCINVGYVRYNGEQPPNSVGRNVFTGVTIRYVYVGSTDYDIYLNSQIGSLTTQPAAVHTQGLLITELTWGNGSATISWSTPSGDVEVLSYSIQNVTTGEDIDVGLVNTYVISGLTNGQTYTFTVTPLLPMMPVTQLNVVVVAGASMNLGVIAL